MVIQSRFRKEGMSAADGADSEGIVPEQVAPENGVVSAGQLFDGQSFSYRLKKFWYSAQTASGQTERSVRPGEEFPLYVKRGQAYEVIQVQYIGMARTTGGKEVPIVKYNDKNYPLKETVDGPDIFDKGLALLNR